MPPKCTWPTSALPNRNSLPPKRWGCTEMCGQLRISSFSLSSGDFIFTCLALVRCADAFSRHHDRAASNIQDDSSGPGRLLGCKVENRSGIFNPAEIDSPVLTLLEPANRGPKDCFVSTRGNDEFRANDSDQHRKNVAPYWKTVRGRLLY